MCLGCDFAIIKHHEIGKKSSSFYKFASHNLSFVIATLRQVLYGLQTTIELKLLEKCWRSHRLSNDSGQYLQRLWITFLSTQRARHNESNAVSTLNAEMSRLALETTRTFLKLEVHLVRVQPFWLGTFYVYRQLLQLFTYNFSDNFFLPTLLKWQYC
jgi:hypothetical protein